MMYEEYEDHRGRTEHALVFFLFSYQRFDESGCSFASNGESSLKISACLGYGVTEQTSKHTEDSLRDWRLFYYCLKCDLVF